MLWFMKSYFMQSYFDSYLLYFHSFLCMFYHDFSKLPMAVVSYVAGRDSC